MRRIDVMVIGLGVFLFGGLTYLLLQGFGLEQQTAGIWSQVVLVIGLISWVLTYLFRVGNQTMTYNQQLKEYQESVLQERLKSLTPEQLAALQADDLEGNLEGKPDSLERPSMPHSS